MRRNWMDVYLRNKDFKLKDTLVVVPQIFFVTMTRQATDMAIHLQLSPDGRP